MRMYERIDVQELTLYQKLEPEEFKPRSEGSPVESFLIAAFLVALMFGLLYAYHTLV